jgi:protein-L-isoaspartate(D-aspartate) O-methyltransferase
MTLSADTNTMRHSMVASQLRTSAVNDARVVEAMARVPRERFVPEAVRAIAYADKLLPLVGGRFQNVPLATGRLLTEAQVRADDHVLLIGAAGGYTAALLSGLVASVVAVEEEASLAALAREALGGFGNVTLVEGALNAGAADKGPYDLLVIDGAVEEVSETLLAQLKPGARVVAGLVDRGVTRLASGMRTDGGFGLTDFADCECAILPGFERARSFQF